MVRCREIKIVALALVLLITMSGCFRVYTGGPIAKVSHDFAKHLEYRERIEVTGMGYKELEGAKQFVVLTEFPSEKEDRFTIDQVRGKIVSLYFSAINYLNSKPKYIAVTDEYDFAKDSITLSLVMGRAGQKVEKHQKLSELEAGSYRAEIDEQKIIRYTLINSKEVLHEESLSDAIKALEAREVSAQN